MHDPEEPPLGLTTRRRARSHAKWPRPCGGSQPRAGNGDQLLEPLRRRRGQECRHGSGCADRTEEASTRVLTSLVEVPGNILKGAVQAQGEVRGAAADATADDTQSTAGRARGPIREAVASTATKVTKRVAETARDVASTVKKATDDTRASMKKATDDHARR